MSGPNPYNPGQQGAQASQKLTKRELRGAIGQRRALFFGGLPKMVPPPIIHRLFLEEYGGPTRLLLDTKRAPAKQETHSSVHRGSGFAVFPTGSFIPRAHPFCRYLAFDGHIIKIRLALTEKDSKAKSLRTKEERRKVHLSDFSGRISLPEIMRAVEKYGIVQEICYIPSDSNQQTSCFVIFEEPYIADRLSKLRVELRPGHFATFEVAFTPKELQDRGLRTKLAREQTAGNSATDSQNPNLRFNRSSYRARRTSLLFSQSNQGDLRPASQQRELFRKRYLKRMGSESTGYRGRSIRRGQRLPNEAGNNYNNHLWA